MKRFLSLFIVAIMMFALPAQAMAAETSTQPNVWAEDEVMPTSSYYTMATYYDTDFYLCSTKKTVTLENFCIQITYRCTLGNNNTESMFLVIEDLNGGNYSQSVTVTADGNSHTMSLFLPAGRYNVYAHGEISNLHTVFAVNFKAYA